MGTTMQAESGVTRRRVQEWLEDELDSLAEDYRDEDGFIDIVELIDAACDALELFDEEGDPPDWVSGLTTKVVEDGLWNPSGKRP